MASCEYPAYLWDDIRRKRENLCDKNEQGIEGILEGREIDEKFPRDLSLLLFLLTHKLNKEMSIDQRVGRCMEPRNQEK
jgi:hypothetical protein